ncbi:MAG TPA: hypothetical protein VKR58_10945 [Aquella sp.]|nr:hypothetical protein [Aquella sp.]
MKNKFVKTLFLISSFCIVINSVHALTFMCEGGYTLDLNFTAKYTDDKFSLDSISLKKNGSPVIGGGEGTEIQYAHLVNSADIVLFKVVSGYDKDSSQMAAWSFGLQKDMVYHIVVTENGRDDLRCNYDRGNGYRITEYTYNKLVENSSKLYKFLIPKSIKIETP